MVIPGSKDHVEYDNNDDDYYYYDDDDATHYLPTHSRLQSQASQLHYMSDDTFDFTIQSTICAENCLCA